MVVDVSKIGLKARDTERLVGWMPWALASRGVRLDGCCFGGFGGSKPGQEGKKFDAVVWK
jgi:hypothetical protein